MWVSTVCAFKLWLSFIKGIPINYALGNVCAVMDISCQDINDGHQLPHSTSILYLKTTEPPMATNVDYSAVLNAPNNLVKTSNIQYNST